MVSMRLFTYRVEAGEIVMASDEGYIFMRQLPVCQHQAVGLSDPTLAHHSIVALEREASEWFSE